MVSTQHALINLAMNEEVSRYVAHLEKKVLYLLLDNLKCRTVLELLTDESWDDEQFPNDEEGLKAIAVSAFVARIGLSEEDAAAVVNERWTTYNAAPVPDETASYIIGPKINQASRPTASTAENFQTNETSPSPGYDVAKHKRGLEIAAANRQKG